MAKYSQKELEKLLERVKPMLGENIIGIFTSLIALAKQPELEPQLERVGDLMSYIIATSPEIDPFSWLDEMPIIDPYFHSAIVGLPGTGKSVYSDYLAVHYANTLDDLVTIIPDTEGDRGKRIITWMERSSCPA